MLVFWCCFVFWVFFPSPSKNPFTIRAFIVFWGGQFLWNPCIYYFLVTNPLESVPLIFFWEQTLWNLYIEGGGTNPLESIHFLFLLRTNPLEYVDLLFLGGNKLIGIHAFIIFGEDNPCGICAFITSWEQTLQNLCIHYFLGGTNPLEAIHLLLFFWEQSLCNPCIYYFWGGQTLYNPHIFYFLGTNLLQLINPMP